MNKMRTDSFMRVINKELAEKSRVIEIEGVKSIADSIISVYNEEGIKAIALFDNQINYTYELAVPIKYFNLSTDIPVKIYYNIKLNGAATNNATIQLMPNGRFYAVTTPSGRLSYVIPAGPKCISYTFPTDFWGEYTLAKE
jgi:hypothetical protein